MKSKISIDVIFCCFKIPQIEHLSVFFCDLLFLTSYYGAKVFCRDQCGTKIIPASFPRLVNSKKI